MNGKILSRADSCKQTISEILDRQHDIVGDLERIA